MSTQWLSIQSFQQSQDFLSALNTLSIHLKLKLAGIEDNKRTQSSIKAKEKISSFLKILEEVVCRFEQAKAEPLTGIDPRLQQLAKKFVYAKQNESLFKSFPFSNPLKQLVELLDTTKEEEQKILIELLAELRNLFEEHIFSDMTQVLKEI